jgi:hypothetical protein
VADVPIVLGKIRFKSKLTKKEDTTHPHMHKNKSSIHAIAHYVERRRITPEWAESSLSPPFRPSTSMMHTCVVLDDDNDYDDNKRW